MTETKQGEKKTLTLTLKSDQKKGGDSGQVHQSFSHGRTKAVAVEVKKKRAPQTQEIKQAQQTAKVVASGKLTEGEFSARMRALQEAIKNQAVESEEKTRREAFEAVRREEQGKLNKQRDEVRLLEEDVRAKKAQQIRELEEQKIALQQEKEQKIKEREESAKETISEPSESSRDRSKDKNFDRENRDQQNQIRSAPAPIGVEQDTLLPTKVEGRSSESAKSAPKSTRSFEDRDDEGGARRRAAGVAENKKAAPPAPNRRGDSGNQGKLNRNVLSRALEGDEIQRSRSLASLKRARQKHKSHHEEEQVMIVREVIIPDFITVGELANRMAVRSAEVIKALMKSGMMVTINQSIDADTAELICGEFGHTPKRVSDSDVELGLKGIDDTDANLISRAPVVTIMGHVDHGKTSLLDALRKTDVVAGEAGGITQHIGAYQVTLPSRKKITFIDTPGHAAFTEMRARGANVTDIVVLVVAADDGIMEQTKEAINHAKAANVPVIVAINKIDKPEANADKVRAELLNYGLVCEEFGGEVMSVEVSAKKGMNLDKLEETILLQAEILDLKSNPNRSAEGVVVEAKVDRGRGTVATILIQRGTLKAGDIFVAGTEWGRVRAIMNDLGHKIEVATPSMPVEILGFNGVPTAGDEFFVVADEARAREVAEFRQRTMRDRKSAASARGTMEQMMSQIAAGEVKELAVVVKTDVQGSLEAILQSLNKLATDEVAVRVLHGAVGGINESDVTLARASNGIVIGFNVRANPQARDLARRDGLDIRYYSIIYDVIDDAKAVLSGLLAPTLRENFLGYAEIRDVFNITKVGKVAGCYVTSGVVKRGAKVRLLREDVVIHEGTLKTLKRFKDEVKEVKESYECGMAFENYNDIRTGDVIECFEIESIARQL